MSKFKEYCASYITPQYTLLEKFNALLKYLEENSGKFEDFIEFRVQREVDNVAELTTEVATLFDAYLQNHSLDFEKVIKITGAFSGTYDFDFYFFPSEVNHRSGEYMVTMLNANYSLSYTYDRQANEISLLRIEEL